MPAYWYSVLQHVTATIIISIEAANRSSPFSLCMYPVKFECDVDCYKLDKFSVKNNIHLIFISDSDIVLLSVIEASSIQTIKGLTVSVLSLMLLKL
jgi:hypothetical protein